MAEAIVNAKMGKNWQAYSAGTHPTGFVHPDAIRVLNEIGIDHQGRSKSVGEFHKVHFDLIVTVCDSAAEECPLWLGPGRRVHLGFPDPAKATGNQAEILAEFRSVRDGILQKILPILEKE